MHRNRIYLLTFVLGIHAAAGTAYALPPFQFDGFTFEPFYEPAADLDGRPGFQLIRNGNAIGEVRNTRNDRPIYTLWKFADLTSDRWTLTATMEIPQRFTNVWTVNSGVLFLYEDPRDFIPLPADLTPEQARAFRTALDQAAQKRANRSGGAEVGPYEVEYFSHELQLIAGVPPQGLPPENKGSAAFYDVDVVDQLAPGTQVKYLSYELFPGDTYTLTMKHDRGVTRSYLSSAAGGGQRVLVSEFWNNTVDVDPVRGGSPRALLLQAFYNDDFQKLPIFTDFSLVQQ